MKKFINLSRKSIDSKRVQGLSEQNEIINVTPPVVDPFLTEEGIEALAKEVVSKIKNIVEGERCIVHLDHELNTAFIFYFIKNKRFNMELVTSSWENGKLVRFIKLV